MASNAGEKENDKSKDGVPAIGETIPIVAKLGSGEENGAVNRGDEGGDREERPAVGNRRRKSVGSRLANLKSKIADGTASEEEKTEYERENKNREGRRGSTEKPPNVDGDTGPRVKGAWRAKYGDTNDRERVCVAMASYWATGLVRLSKYIDDNGGDPLIDLTGEPDSPTRMELNGLLVLACDDILPAGFVVSAALIAAGATTTMLIQGAIVARHVSAQKTPQKAGVKTPEERAEDELERARKARPANPPDEPAPQKAPVASTEDKSKPPRERGVV
jgi:hypothetical protein